MIVQAKKLRKISKFGIYSLKNPKNAFLLIF